jgi:hypothetical protein
MTLHAASGATADGSPNIPHPSNGTSPATQPTRQARRLETCAPARNLSQSNGSRASGRGLRRWRPRCRR